MAVGRICILSVVQSTDVVALIWIMCPKINFVFTRSLLIFSLQKYFVYPLFYYYFHSLHCQKHSSDRHGLRNEHDYNEIQHIIRQRKKQALHTFLYARKFISTAWQILLCIFMIMPLKNHMNLLSCEHENSTETTYEIWKYIQCVHTQKRTRFPEECKNRYEFV